MKKIMFIIITLCFFAYPSYVKASDYVDKIVLSAAISTDLTDDNIEEIRVALDITPSNGEAWYFYETKLLKENNFRVELKNEILKGDISIHYIMAFPDAGGTKYTYNHSFIEHNEDDYEGKISVEKRILETSSTANTDKFEDAVYDHIMDSSDRNNYQPTTKKITTTTGDTTTTTSPNGSTTTATGNSDIIIGGDPTTSTTTKNNEETEEDKEKEKKEQQRKEEEEQRKEKENIILMIMLIIIGSAVIIFIFITAVKIYQANKLI